MTTRRTQQAVNDNYACEKAQKATKLREYETSILFDGVCLCIKLDYGSVNFSPNTTNLVLRLVQQRAPEAAKLFATSCSDENHSPALA